MIIKIIFYSYIFSIFIFSPLFVKAEDYDFYVDINYSGEESDGSKEKPFQSIKKALEKIEEKDFSKIYIKNGEYKESINLKKGIKLYGQNKNKVILKISSSLNLDGNNVLKNLTISGGAPAIMILGQKIEIDNCIIKNSGTSGIQTAESVSNVSVKNSEIFQNRKGFYLQKETEVKIINNKIFNNFEEGIDIREESSGLIKNNQIYNNKESGIEIIVGKADISISENKITKNSSSGIAVQFYDYIRNTGKIKLSQNIIAFNENYGINCKSPSGGKPSSSSYWDESLDLIENKIENNKRPSISKSCKIISAITEKEEKTNLIIETKNIETEQELVQKQEKELEEKRIAEEKESGIKNKILDLRQKIEEDKFFLEKKEKEIANLNKIRVFFIGTDLKKLAEINHQIQEIEKNLFQIKENIANLSNLTEEEEKKSLEEYVKNFEEKIKEKKIWIEKEKNRFGLFVWLVKLFK